MQMQQEKNEQREYRKKILQLAEQMQYDDDIEESVVQFRANVNDKPGEDDTKQMKEAIQEVDQDDDSDLHMDAETIFIEK